MTTHQEPLPEMKMDPVDIYSGGLKVISSGTITSFEQQPIKIIFGPRDKRLNLILSFIDKCDADNKPTKRAVEAKNLDNDSFELIFSNFNSPLGSYSVEPVHIADFSGLPVLFSFFIIAHKESGGKTIHFTLYLETSEEPKPGLEVSRKWPQ